MSNSVYRYLREEDFADQLANGDIYLSTLSECRKFENSQRGDKEEGFEHYFSNGCQQGSGKDSELVERASRLSIDISEDSEDILILGNRRVTIVQDAYVLCTTLGFSDQNLNDDFGRFCVEITNVWKFSELVSAKLNDHVHWTQFGMGPIKYADRYYEDLEQSPGPIGFVKPKDLYADQKEFRFLWYVSGVQELSPIKLHCPEAVQFMKRIA